MYQQKNALGAGLAMLVVVPLLCCLWACDQRRELPNAIYHWKTDAVLSEKEDSLLSRAGIERIYLRYFDVDFVQVADKMEAAPVAVIREVGQTLKSLDIVPVVFVTPRVLKDRAAVPAIADKISDLIKQISQHHFAHVPEQIQLDCDWTESTRAAFFDLVEHLKRDYEVSVTLRLHQLKYAESSGVPPVDRASLMLYNVGALSDFSENSILTADVVSQYISSGQTYPLSLDLALPVFSQTVIKNNNKRHRLLRGDHSAELAKDPDTFRQIATDEFEVLRDTLYNGFYLYRNYRLKVEAFDLEEIEQSLDVISASRLDIRSRIYYHLDEDYVDNLHRLLEIL